MEKIAAGKQAKQFYTIAETEQGVRVFNDGLSGTIKFRDYLQSTADNFYSSSLQDVESLNIYRIETVSRRMLELSNGNQTTMPQAGMEILANYKPSVTFDMHPTGENLNRFVTAGALELSIRNRNIMTLQDIAARGYAHLPADESFAIKRISCLWRKVSVRLPGKRNCTGIILSGRRWMNYKMLPGHWRKHC